MNKTPNYQLNQWAADDRVLRTDFNADNAKLDAAIKAVDGKADTKADASALNALAAEVRSTQTTLSTTAAAIPKIAVGTYAGDGAATRFISVGFTPRAVFVTTADGYTYVFGDGYSPSQSMGGLAVTDHFAGLASCPSVQIVSGGFQVAYRERLAFSNQTNNQYNYLAIG